MSINKRKCLSIRDKVEIIQELEHGEKNVEVCKKFNLSPSTFYMVTFNCFNFYYAWSRGIRYNPV
jgi:Mor family transcriptional regulator